MVSLKVKAVQLHFFGYDENLIQLILGVVHYVIIHLEDNRKVSSNSNVINQCVIYFFSEDSSLGILSKIFVLHFGKIKVLKF